MNKNTILTIINIVVIIFVVWLSFEVLNAGIYRAERAECEQWERASKIYPDFYYADWQLKQCGLFDSAK